MTTVLRCVRLDLCYGLRLLSEVVIRAGAELAAHYELLCRCARVDEGYRSDPASMTDVTMDFTLRSSRLAPASDPGARISLTSDG